MRFAAIGFGQDASGKRLRDLWRLNMRTLEMRRLADLPGDGRRHPAMNFVVSEEGAAAGDAGAVGGNAVGGNASALDTT
jgi:hypothetical protein